MLDTLIKIWGGNIEKCNGSQAKPASSLIRIVAIKFVLAFIKNIIKMQGEALEKGWDYL